jgi:hypothetical protein
LPVVYSEKSDSILSVGIWLEPYHRNWALTKTQALDVIGDLRDANFIVLGGDVLEGPDKKYRHTAEDDARSRNTFPAPGGATLVKRGSSLAAQPPVG